MTTEKTFTVLGAGAMGWGIAYIVSSYQKAEVRIWDRDSDLIAETKKTRVNAKYSNPEIRMPKKTILSSDLKESIKGSDFILLAVPSFAVREMSQRMSKLSLPPLIMLSKGMEKETSLLPFQVIEEVLGSQDILHLTGAGYGKEVHKKIPATETLASKDENLLIEVKSLLETDWLTIELSTDLIGSQLAGALKNVMIIGIGLAENGKENSNIRTGLIKEGVREMKELGRAMGAKEETFEGPAGKGDLEISADPLSRNYRLGQSLFEKGVDQVQKDLEEKRVTVEGFHTAWAAYQLATKYNVRLPIIEEVYGVIYKKVNPKVSASNLRKLL
ncbi:MAG: NAD(P)H-dependent glycerol-3-phosphate dehydrogenase [Candidatus Nealsonbacteria bacterium]